MVFTFQPAVLGVQVLFNPLGLDGRRPNTAVLLGEAAGRHVVVETLHGVVEVNLGRNMEVTCVMYNFDNCLDWDLFSILF